MPTLHKSIRNAKGVQTLAIRIGSPKGFPNWEAIKKQQSLCKIRLSAIRNLSRKLSSRFLSQLDKSIAPSGLISVGGIST